MTIFNKAAFGMVLAASAFTGLTATTAAAQDRYSYGNGYSSHYDNGYNGDYRDQRYDHDSYRDNDRRYYEWRRNHRHHEWRHNDRRDNDWRDNGRHDDYRRQDWGGGYGY